MAKNVRLDLAPGKAEKLAQLRGIDKWEFAGINDSYMEGNFKAHCELGHRLRYEYFAIPEGVLDENHNIRTKDRVVGFRTRRDTVQDLRDAGAIVFGETCAGDFFHISPEDMKKLVKTRKTMSDEIELMSNILANHLEESYKSKCKLLYQIIAKLGNTENVIKVFGENVGYTLLAFIKAAMPFPMSLVIIAAEQARKDLSNFYITVFPEYKKVINMMLNSKAEDDKGTEVGYGQSLVAGGNLLWFIAEYTLEGDYQYDPTTDEESIRKDIGRYNKDTRAKREAEQRSLILGTSVNVKILKDIKTIENYLKSAEFYLEIAKETAIYFNAHKELVNKYKKFETLGKALENMVTERTESVDSETEQQIAEKKEIEHLRVMITSSVNFLKLANVDETEFYLVREYNKTYVGFLTKNW